jgi:hypothetical protein
VSRRTLPVIVTLAALAANAGVAITSSAQTAKRPSLSEADSLNNVREAERALRRYWSLATGFWGVHERPRLGSPTYVIEAMCEYPLGNYCHGPTNGQLAFGSRVATMPVEFLMSDRAVIRNKRGITKQLFTEAMAKLDRAQEVAPGDRWITGQRVFHRVERAELNDAASVAQQCRTERWWCDALVGYTKHLLGLSVAADSAFDAALRSMPDSVRCEWENLDLLVADDDLNPWYRDLGCSRRVELNRTLWWLSDPLHLVPGNDRRAAHYFRMVHASLSRGSDVRLPPHVEGGMLGEISFPPHGPAYGWAVIRMGVPTYLGFGIPPGPRQPPVLVLQYRRPVYHFIPSLAAARSPLSASSADWTPSRQPMPEHFRASFGAFSTLQSQLAWFRRGDSARVVGGVDVPGDTLLRRAGLVGGALVLARSSAATPRIVRESPDHPWVFAATVAPESTLVSFEALATGVGAGHSRYASGPPPMPRQRVGLSDVLMLTSADSLPADLERAASRVARHTRASRDAPLGLYWEVYGLQPGDTVALTLAAVERVRSGGGQAGRPPVVADGADRTEVRWRESRIGQDGITGMAVALDLRSLRRGRFTLELKVEVRGEQPVSVRREIVIVEPS